MWHDAPRRMCLAELSRRGFDVITTPRSRCSSRVSRESHELYCDVDGP